MKSRCTWRRARSMQPSDSGWRSSMRPFAIVVVAKGRRWRSISALSSPTFRSRIADAPITATGRRAFRSSVAATLDRGLGRWRSATRRRHRRHVLGRRRHRHVLGQVEMDGPRRLAQRDRERLREHRRHATAPQRQRRLRDRTEERVVIDRHLDAAADLRGRDVAGDRDHRRAVEIGAPHARREVRGAGAERGDAEAGHPGETSGDVRGEGRRALVRGEHERQPFRPHRVHQRQHVAARNAEAVADAGRPQRADDQLGVGHVRRTAGGSVHPRAARIAARRAVVAGSSTSTLSPTNTTP